MNAAEQALAFCSVLFTGDAGEHGELAGQHVTIFVLPSRSIHWVSLDDPAAIAAAAVEADAGGGTGVYVSMGSTTELAAPQSRKGRMRAEEVGAIYGVWADLDIAGPAHSADNLPPDLTAVRRILDEMGLAPTLLWSSGNGFQAFWAFDAPLVIDSPAERERAKQLVADWLRSLAAHAHRLGRWRIDAVQDLARVLRVPGTTNRKPAVDGTPRPDAPVELIECEPDRRYSPDEIAEHCLDAAFLAEHEAMVAPSKGDAMAVDLAGVWKLCNSREYRERNYEPEWITDLLEVLAEETATSEAARTVIKIWEWSGCGRPFADHSRADASMARFLANFDLDERDAAEVLTLMRLRSKHKIEKVQPTRRGQDYLVANTIGKTFASARAAKLKRVADIDAADALLAAQDAEAAAAASIAAAGAYAAPQAGLREITEPDGKARVSGLAGTTQRAREALIERVLVEDVEPEPDEPLPDEPEPEPDDEPEPDPRDEHDEPAHDDPADAPPAGQSDNELSDDELFDDELPVDEVPLDEPAPAAAGGGGDEPPPIDPPRAAPREPDPEPVGRSPFGPRPESTATLLKALSAELISERMGEIQVWQPQQRGRGAEAKRRLMLRLGPNVAWPDGPPESYQPGEPLYTGWWPAATFDKVGGWIRVLEQDTMIVCDPVNADDFRTRYAKPLVRLWRPDTSGGSLASVLRQALRQFLLDYPPSRDWTEAVTVGTPWIVAQSPAWTVAEEFAVSVRWLDLGRFLRANFAVPVTPSVLAEMIELTGATDAITPSQEGRWKMLRRDYFDDRTWAQVLEGGQNQAMRREDRRGMHVVRDADTEHGDGLDDTLRRGVRNDGTAGAR